MLFTKRNENRAWSQVKLWERCANNNLFTQSEHPILCHVSLRSSRYIKSIYWSWENFNIFLEVDRGQIGHNVLNLFSQQLPANSTLNIMKFRSKLRNGELQSLCFLANLLRRIWTLKAHERIKHLIAFILVVRKMYLFRNDIVLWTPGPSSSKGG